MLQTSVAFVCGLLTVFGHFRARDGQVLTQIMLCLVISISTTQFGSIFEFSGQYGTLLASGFFKIKDLGRRAT